MPRNPNKTRCSVPDCRAWAIHGSDPPLCSPHSGRTGAPAENQNHLVHGFYATTLQPDEAADVAAYPVDDTLEPEIAVTRVALRRIHKMLLTGHTLGPDPQPLGADAYARFCSLAFQGAGALSRLLRTRRALGPTEDEVRWATLDAALDAIAEEWGMDL